MGKIVRIETDEGIAEIDADARTHRIQTPEGGLIIRAFNGVNPREVDPDREDDHNENLAEMLEEGALGNIAAELIPAIESDWTTSADRRADIQKALKLLAIRVEESKSAAVDGQSVIRSPLLLEAVLGFQSNAVGELLPASGPVKMRYDGDAGEDEETLQLTEDLERDFNHYLTTIASEYYPDTTRMLFDDVGLAGSGFKKVYPCPLRKRPVSESVASEDLIVNAGATDLANAQRITQRVKVSQAVMKRLMWSGHYRNIVLATPNETATPLELDKARVTGLGAVPQMPATHRYTLYECYCDWDLPGFEHKDEKGELTGLPLPYRITVDTISQKVLEIRRDWKADDETFKRRKTFCKWPFVEALGFYCLGLMHILSNTTEAMTSAWRVLIDAGMFSNFPGLLYAKDSNKAQESNVIRVGPGEAKGIQTGGRPISDVVMPLPYKGPDQAFIALANLITEAAQRVGMTAQLQVGEGKQDAPVGTTIALLEQATKMMAAVHKGLHAAQSEEFQMLKELFREDPDAFWRHMKKPSRSWSAEQFQKALDDNDIVPAADPNTPSHMHRLMRVIGLVQMATTFPELIEEREVAKLAIEVLGFNSVTLLKPPPEEMGPPPPPPPLPVDPVGMVAVEAKKAGDLLRAQTDMAKIQSTEKIAGAQLRQKAQADQQKLWADHIKERAKLASQARMTAMKQLGIGTRVI